MAGLRYGRRLKLGAAMWAGAAAVFSVAGAEGAHAQRLDNRIAVFAALDKVTARISQRKVPLNSTDEFGSLKITPRVCHSRPPDEQPKTTTFVEVDEMLLNGQQKRLFTGWMFAESPGLHAVEHPVFDVWLIGCEGSSEAVAGRATKAGKGAAGERSPERGVERSRRRVRR